MNVKKEAVEDLKNKRIKLSTLFNVLSDDVTKLLKGGYTIGEIVLKIEDMNDVKINHGTATTWIRRNKKKLLEKGDTQNEEKSIRIPQHRNTENGSNQRVVPFKNLPKQAKEVK